VEHFEVTVGGHKFLCRPDTEDEGALEAAQGVAIGLALEWECDADEDGWAFYFEEDISVPFVWKDERSDEENYGYSESPVARPLLGIL
jgi:hypothetical protein